MLDAISSEGVLVKRAYSQLAPRRISLKKCCVNNKFDCFVDQSADSILQCGSLLDDDDDDFDDFQLEG